MRLGHAQYANCRAVVDRGTVVVFAARSAATKGSVPAIGYSVLLPGGEESDTWTDFQLLEFPDEVRPVGMRLISAAVPATQVIAAAEPFQVISDGAFIYVFRQSSAGTLLVDRFVLDPDARTLAPAREVRFRRSRRPDLPAGPKDTFGSTDMNGVAFREPTLELTMVTGVASGRFSVLIVPTALSAVSRWQIMVANSNTGALDSWSLKRSDDGLFDLTDAIDPTTGAVLPDNSFTLQDGQSKLALESGPASVLYDRQEPAEDGHGRLRLFRRETRLMTAVAAGPSSAAAVLDFGVGQDGRIAQVGPTLPVAPAPAPPGNSGGVPPFSALAFAGADGTQVSIAGMTAWPGSTGTIESWVQLSALAAGGQAIVSASAPAGGQGATFTMGVSASAAPVFTVSVAGSSATALGPPLALDSWYHLAGTWSLAGGTLTCQLLVNGNPRGAAGPALNVPAPAPGVLLLGGSGGLTGLLDEVRLWNVARTPGQIVATMGSALADPLDPALVGYWPLDEPLAGTPPASTPNRVSAGPPGAISGARWIASNAPTGASMPVVAWDANGLTACTTLLPFASAQAPALFAGGDGDVRLLSGRATDGILTGARFDATTVRPQYVTRWDTGSKGTQHGTLRFAARQAGTAMNPAPTPYIAIADDPNPKHPDTYQVTLSSWTGYTETWPAVPTELGQFIAVLYGRAIDPAPAADAPPDALIYDYASVNVVAAGGERAPAPAAGAGSALFTVSADTTPEGGATGVVLTTDPSTNPVLLDRAGIDTAWIADPPLAALALNQGSQSSYVNMSAQTGNPLALAQPGDVCVEAWVNPTALPTSGLATVLFETDGQSTSYMLALDPTGAPVAGKGNGSAALSVAASAPASRLALNTWSHVAASYDAAHGLQLGKKRYADAGNPAELGMTEALTLEAWVKLDAIGSPQAVVSREYEYSATPWWLGVGADGTPQFTVTTDVGGIREPATVSGAAPLTPGTWHHLAGVFDTTSRREVAVEFSSPATNVSSLVAIPALTTAPTGAVSVAMWVKPRAKGLATAGTILFWAGLSASSPSFVLSLDYSRPEFSVITQPGGKSNPVAGGALVDDVWSHVVGTYDPAAGLQLYVDGVLVASVPLPGGPPLQQNTWYFIGGLQVSSPAYPFDGFINEVSLWNRALSPYDIRDIMGRPLEGDETGLVGYWPLQDGSGTKAVDQAGNSNGLLKAASFTPVRKGILAQRLIVDGQAQAARAAEHPAIRATADVRLGAGAGNSYLTGTLGPVAVWKTGRATWQVVDDMSGRPPGDGGDLVAAWRFSDDPGPVVRDSAGGHDARIASDAGALDPHEIVAMWVSIAVIGSWTICVDGVAVPTSPISVAGLPTTTQFQLAAMAAGPGSSLNPLSAELAEIRLWSRQRTPAEIAAARFRPLAGDEDGLAGYWPLDAGTGQIVADRSPSGNLGQLVGPGGWVISTAPVGLDPPAVRNVFWPLSSRSGLDQVILGAPAMAEYGDLRADARGALTGSLNWCLVYVDSNQALNLVSGYRVGELDVEFVGQVQTRPTLVGYIEGAPPLPGENLTVDSPQTPYKYLAASAITLSDAESASYRYTAARDRGFDHSYEVRGGFAAGFSVFALTYKLSGGVRAVFDNSLGWLHGATVRTDVRATADTTIEVFGSWLTNPYTFLANVPRYYLPNNKGLALVTSATADLYALRDRGTGAQVAYALRPSPGVPRDVNLIMFVLDPQYVKNGTLDGWVGPVRDVDHPYLKPGERGSYFKPAEAYALKEQIAREQQQLKTYYDHFEAGALGRRQEGTMFQSEDPAEAELDELLETDEQAFTRRSLANTYVWNSDGGLHAEEQQTAIVREESEGGSYDFVGKVGFYAKLESTIGPEFALDALWGGHIRTRVEKTHEQASDFGITVRMPGEGFLNERLPDGTRVDLGAYPVPYGPDACAGKVNQYRFSTFYLTPTKDNFDAFTNIVDPEWLASTDVDAAALRQALASQNEVWRVLHRVTYVNRVVGDGKPTSGETIAPDVRLPDPDSLAANILLLEQLPVPPGNPRGALPAIYARLTSTTVGPLAALQASPLWQPLLTTAITQQTVRDVMAYMAYRPFVELTGVAVIPANPSVAVGHTTPLRALALYGDRSSQDVTTHASWTSTNPGIATVAPNGAVTGVAAGSTNVTAAWSTLSGSAKVTVT